MTEREALDILRVDQDCSPEQLRQAYVDLVKVWHPDRFQADARLRQKADQTLRGINAAYAVLQQPTVRGGSASSSERTRPESQPRAERARQDPQPSAEPQTVAPPTPPIQTRHRVLLAAVIGAAIGVVLVLAAVLRPSPAPSLPVDAADPSPAGDVELKADRRPSRSVSDPGRPESGSELRSAAHKGTGWLSARNGTRHDAVVLLDGDVAQERVFFVRRGEQVTLFDLLPGTYRVRVMLGEEWTGRAFQRPAGHYERQELATVAAHEGARDAKPLAIVIDDRIGVRPVPVFGLD